MRYIMRKSILLVSFAVGCANKDISDGAPERLAVARQDLTNAEITRILSFEGVIGSNGDWVPTGGTVLSSTAHASAGARSIVMSGASYISVQSTTLSALGSVGANLGVDVWLPTSLVGLSNKGNVQVFFTAPSLGLFSYSTSNVALAPLTPGQFSRINIPLDSTLRTKLSQAAYSDLSITLAFNLADTTGQTFVDQVTTHSGTGGTGGTGGAGGASAGATATGGMVSGGSSGRTSGGTTNTGGISALGGNSTGGASTSGAATGGTTSGGTSGRTGGGTTNTGGETSSG
ncbi:MAG TPA: hypothetical protein VIV60_12780, partial [Polyangiaceae bacterium]